LSGGTPPTKGFTGHMYGRGKREKSGCSGFDFRGHYHCMLPLRRLQVGVASSYVGSCRVQNSAGDGGLVASAGLTVQHFQQSGSWSLWGFSRYLLLSLLASVGSSLPVKPLTFLIVAVYLARPLCALKALASVWGVLVLKTLTALQFEASAAVRPPVVHALRCDVAACLVWRGGCCSCFVPALPRRRRGMGSVDSWPLAKPLRMEHQGMTVTGDGAWKQALDSVAVPQQAL
jgi:hypothetical protein